MLARDDHALRDGWNDVSGPLDPHRITDPDVLPGDLVGVVERRSADSDASHIHRFEQGQWGQRSGAADRDHNVLHLGDLFARGELVGDGPARTSGFLTEGFLPVAAIDLHHHAINFKRQLVADRLGLGVKRDDLFDPGATAPMQRDR